MLTRGIVLEFTNSSPRNETLANHVNFLAHGENTQGQRH